MRQRLKFQALGWFFAGITALLLTGPLPARAAEVEKFYHLDAVGTVRAITDRNGVVLERLDYHPFGEDVTPPTTTNTRRFAGKERDRETAIFGGLDYFGARYYFGRIARFTTVDPATDISRSLSDPQDWNRYAYARNNPLRNVDPDGRSWVTKGFRLIFKGGDVASTFAGVVDDGAVLFSADPTVGTAARLLAAASLTSELLPVSGRDVKEGAELAVRLTKADTLKPGPFAVGSIPAHRGRPSAAEQTQVNDLMAAHGCHTCGTKNPGTKSGNAIADHQPAQALGEPKVFLPHCNTCKARQGGQVLQELRRVKEP